jgi:hypothetical protein
MDVCYALNALRSITEETSFRTLSFEIIKNLGDSDLDLFVKLYLNIELFSHSAIIVLVSIHIDAYAAATSHIDKFFFVLTLYKQFCLYL